MADSAEYQARWRNKARLDSILEGFKKLPKRLRKREVLLLATDAARLSRAYVGDRVNDSLALLGEDLIESDETNDDAGDE